MPGDEFISTNDNADIPCRNKGRISRILIAINILTPPFIITL
jgi:hypothetical protein